MSNATATVTLQGRKDGQEIGGLQVEAGGTIRTLRVGQAEDVPKSIAERCVELRDEYDFEVKGLGGNGNGS